VTETNVHEETKRVEGDRAVGRRSSGLERQRRWASSPNLGKEGERERAVWLRERDVRVGLNKSVNREEEQIVETTKLSLAHEITQLPLPHKQWYKGVYRKGCT
jgi:hypothetical protein